MNTLLIKRPYKLLAGLIVFSALSFSIIPPKQLAIFQATHILVYSDSILYANSNTAIGRVYENPAIEGLIPYKTIENGIIKLNSKSLSFNPNVKFYIDTAFRQNLDIVTWSISQSTAINNFNYQTTKSIPTFTNIANIPNSLNKLQNYKIEFGNVNADKIEVSIKDDQIRINNPSSRRVAGNVSEVMIPKEQLSHLSSNDLKVIVTFINEEDQVIDGKSYRFENRLQIIKKLNNSN